MQHLSISLAAGAVLATSGLAGRITPVAAAPDPPMNMPIGALPSACRQAPVSAVCENAIIYYLDEARSVMGLGPYSLPRDFPSLSADRQIFILSNLDRLAEGLPPVLGLNVALNSSAIEGVASDSDPSPPSELAPPGSTWSSTSNWAGNFPNALKAYYEWMYDDGYGSSNITCTTPTDEGCWGHRQDVLTLFPAEAGGSLSMGAAAGVDQHSKRGFAMIILYTNIAEFPTYYYTWPDAVGEGATTTAYNPGTPSPQVGSVVSVQAGGSGTASAPGTCEDTCLDSLTEMPATISSTKLARLLADQLRSSRGAAKIAPLLSRGVYAAAFKAPEPGTAVIAWYQVTDGKKLARKATVKPLLVAAGKAIFSAAETTTIRVGLTAKGRRLLKHTTQLKLIARDTFTPTRATPVTARTTLTLKR
jgi:hypothetical protein